jgi:hypothetical protein
MHKKGLQRMAEVIDEIYDSNDEDGDDELGAAATDRTHEPSVVEPPPPKKKKTTQKVPAVPIIYVDVDDPKELAQGRVIAFDLETTGFSGKDDIIEIGAVEIINGFRTGSNMFFIVHFPPYWWSHALTWVTLFHCRRSVSIVRETEGQSESIRC